MGMVIHAMPGYGPNSQGAMALWAISDLA